MYDILFINHLKSQCGVYNYGTRIYNIWKKSSIFNLIYKEVGSLDEYNLINFSNYKYILYNYHVCTLPWLNLNTITKDSINIGILHECYPNMFNYCINTQSDIPRPIFEDIPNNIISNDKNVISFLEYGLETNIPIIGSFGFGFTNKGFDKIIKYVNEQYSEAIIKIIMPFADFGDKNGDISRYVSNLCYNVNKNPKIKIMIIHNYLEDSDILYFLNSNTINIFLYDTMIGRGISSTIDFAISVNKPVGISDSYMFRHIYNDSINIYKTTIDSCIKYSKDYVSQFKNIYSHKNNINFIESFLSNIKS